jgi:hypothetical protein
VSYPGAITTSVKIFVISLAAAASIGDDGDDAAESGNGISRECLLVSDGDRVALSDTGRVRVLDDGAGGRSKSQTSCHAASAST